MSKIKGYAQIVDPASPLVERDTAQCCHCGAIIFVKPNTASTVYLIPTSNGFWIEEPGASCFRCMKPVCLGCCEIGTCTPFERLLEQWEKQKPMGRIIGYN